MSKSSKIFTVIKNFVYKFSYTLIVMVIGLIMQKSIITYLGPEYLGINSLIKSLIAYLSISELGIGASITFSLYKPLSNNNKQSVVDNVYFLKKLYIIIGFIITILGLSLMPFLHIIIKDNIDFVNIYWVYSLFLLDTIVQFFFFSYKVILLQADQKAHVVSKVFMSTVVLTFIFKLVSLYFFSNYYLLIGIGVFFSILKYFILSRKTNKLYPYISTLKPKKLKKESSRFVYKNSLALLIYRINGLILNSTDNIILAYFVGLYTVGLYSNYLLIVVNLKKLLNNFFDSVLASIGNFNVNANIFEKKQLFRVCLLIASYMYAVVTICLLCSFGDFIEIWLSAEFVLPYSTVIIIALNLFIYSFLKVYATFRSAMGLFIYGKYRPLIGSFINVVLSIFLVRKYGLNGILLGTLISNLTTFFWYDLLIIYKHGFNSKINQVCVYIVKLISVSLASAFICIYITSLLTNISIISFIFKGIICFLITSCLYWIANHSSPEYKYCISKVAVVLQKFKKK